jgi:hypothetical protein
LQLEVQVVESRLGSESSFIGGQGGESYEDTLKWVVINCSPEDWQYVMDMPALYSLVRPDGQIHDTLLEEESNSSRAGHASSTQDRLALSFKTKVPGIFGGQKVAKNGHPFAAIDSYDKWISTGLKRGFNDQIEEVARTLEATMSKRMLVHLGHKHNAHPIFLTLLTDSVQQMLKLHRMMDSQFLRYQTVLGTACDEGNWILISQFAEALFTGTWRARFIGADAFGETRHNHCASYLWADLQTHRVLQGYIELGFIAHPEVSSVVVEHLIQTRVSMAMHNAEKCQGPTNQG